MEARYSRSQLTKNEYYMMSLFFANDELAVPDIIKLAQEKNWSKSSLHAILGSLVNKGFLVIDGYVPTTKSKARLYKKNISVAEFNAIQVLRNYKEFNQKFDMTQFVSSLVDKSDDNQVIEELKKWYQDNYS